MALQERKLGEIVKEKHGTDFWALEHFPMEVTPHPESLQGYLTYQKTHPPRTLP